MFFSRSMTIHFVSLISDSGIIFFSLSYLQYIFRPMMVPIMQIDNERIVCLIEICSLRSDFIITFSLSIVQSNKKETCLEIKKKRTMLFLVCLLDPNYVSVVHRKKNEWSVVFISTYLHLKMRERKKLSLCVCANSVIITDFFNDL
jgi:hypothetical protein